jgi:2'-5' RNA ligase
MMAYTKNIDAISESLTALQLTADKKNVRLDRIGAFMDDPVNPSIIVRVKHGKILDIAASDAITALTVDELQNLVNAVIFGAFVDWYKSVKST